MVEKLKCIYHSNKKTLHRLTIGVLSLVMMCSVFLTSGVTSYAEGEDVSFYKLSSAASAYYNDAKASGSSDYLSHINSSNAGGLLGYCDEADTSGIIKGWVSSALSNSSISFSYSSFISDLEDIKDEPLAQYCRYGYLLSSMGFDDTGSAGTSMSRIIYGGLMTVFYFGASTVSMLFKGIVNLLQTLNPFKLFGLVTDNLMYKFETIEETSVWYPLVDSVSSMYDAFQNFAWDFAVPLFFVGLVVSILLLRTQNRAGKIRKYVTRLLVMVLCVPFCGSLYTTSLSFLDEDLASFNSQPTRIVCSTFVDFENWAMNQDLAPFTAAHFNASNTRNGALDSAYYRNLRKSAYIVNSKSNLNLGLPDYSSSDGDLASIVYTDVGNTSLSIGTFNSYTAVYEMLGRYMSGSKLHASDYENYAKSKLESFETVKAEIDATDSAVDFKDNLNYLDDGEFFGKNAELVNAGSSDTSYLMYNSDSGLSPIAMYNYLSSKFTPSSVIVYSNERAASDWTRDSHYSVNLIGNDILQFCFWSNTLVQLLTLTVIGWFYGLAIIFSNIKRMFKIILDVPFATLGAVRSGAKIITNTIALIVEIVMTMFAYVLICDILMSFTDIIEAPIVTLFGNIYTGTIVFGDRPLSLFAGEAAMMIALIISSVLYLLFLWQALRLRKSLVRTIDEMMESIVDKFLMAPSNPPEKPGFIQKAAGAVASGAGMAAGAMVMNTVTGSVAPGDEAKGSATDTKDAQSSDDGSGGTSSGGSGKGGKSSYVSGSSHAGLPDKSGSGGGSGDNGLVGTDDGNPSNGGGGVYIDGESVAADIVDSETGEEIAAFDGTADDKNDAQMAEHAMQFDSLDESVGDVDGPVDVGDQIDEQIATNTGSADLDKTADEVNEKVGAVAEVGEGAVETTKGVAEVAAAVETGDVKTGVQGVKDTAGGVQKMNDGAKKLKASDDNGSSQRQNKSGSSSSGKSLNKKNGSQQNGTNGGSSKTGESQSSGDNLRQVKASNDNVVPSVNAGQGQQAKQSEQKQMNQDVNPNQTQQSNGDSGVRSVSAADANNSTPSPQGSNSGSVKTPDAASQAKAESQMKPFEEQVALQKRASEIAGGPVAASKPVGSSVSGGVPSTKQLQKNSVQSSPRTSSGAVVTPSKSVSPQSAPRAVQKSAPVSNNSRMDYMANPGGARNVRNHMQNGNSVSVAEQVPQVPTAQPTTNRSVKQAPASNQNIAVNASYREVKKSHKFNTHLTNEQKSQIASQFGGQVARDIVDSAFQPKPESTLKKELTDDNSNGEFL